MEVPNIDMPEVYKPHCKHSDHWSNIIIFGYCWHCNHKLTPYEEPKEKEIVYPEDRHE